MLNIMDVVKLGAKSLALRSFLLGEGTLFAVLTIVLHILKLIDNVVMNFVTVLHGDGLFKSLSHFLLEEHVKLGFELIFCLLIERDVS